MKPMIRSLACLLAGVGVGAAAGCGGGDAVAAHQTALRGRLVVNKKPLHNGTVTAYRSGSKTAQTNVNPDGRFEFFNLPTGDYQLAVTDTEANTPYGKGVRLPAKYADPAQSGMTVAVAAGEQPPRDFTLEAGR